jgi:hypothetical protein
MSYLCFKEYKSTSATLFSFIYSSIASMGWTLHDNVSGTRRVYKSNGESGNEIYQYIDLEDAGDGTTFRAWGYWNNSTHVGSCGGYFTSGQNKIGSGTAGYVSVFGSKDLVFVRHHGSASQNIYFGHIPKRYFTSPLATLLNNETSGTNVVVELDNVNDFKLNQQYMIFGAAGEGRDPVTVNAVDSGAVTVTISNLPRNYNSGSKIGIAPSLFGCSSTGNSVGFFPTCHSVYAGGTTDLSNAYTLYISYIVPSYAKDRLNPGMNSGLYSLIPMYWGEDSARDLIGYSTIDENFAHVPTTTLDYIWEVQSNPVRIGGIVTGVTANTLTDSTKSWTVNAWQNKFVIIADGLGVGHTRQIASNTATTLTLTNNWNIPPMGSVYYIADEAWRTMSYYYGGMAAKEIL